MLDEVISKQIRELLDGSIAATIPEEVEKVPIRVRLANQHDHNSSRCNIVYAYVSADQLPIVVLRECQFGRTIGRPLECSVYESTRHVLTTSVTTVAGVLPLIMSGGDFFPPMMIVIAGGALGRRGAWAGEGQPETICTDLNGRLLEYGSMVAQKGARDVDR